jgi:hypothetical protein
MLRDRAAKITVAAGLFSLFAVFGGTQSVMAAPQIAGAAHSTASVAGITPRAGRVTCVPVPSSKRRRLEQCSEAVAISRAPAASAPASAQAVAAKLAALSAHLPANATDMTAGVTGGCVYDSDDNPTCQYSLNPGPRQACGGFNGDIYWSDDSGGMDVINTWGEVWSLCAATAYVYLSWQQTAGACGYNEDSGSASAYSTSGVNAQYVPPVWCIGGPSSVHETVCTTEDGGWHCGASVYV